MNRFRHVEAPVELGPMETTPSTTSTTAIPSTTSEEAASTVSTEAGEAPGVDPTVVASVAVAAL